MTREYFASNLILIRDVICGLLGNYTASCGNYLPTFRDNMSVPSHGSLPRYAAKFTVIGFLSYLVS